MEQIILINTYDLPPPIIIRMLIVLDTSQHPGQWVCTHIKGPNTGVVPLQKTKIVQVGKLIIFQNNFFFNFFLQAKRKSSYLPLSSCWNDW